MSIRNLIFSALPFLLFACGKPSVTSDNSNSAGGTASPFLAREVVGTHMLSNDANYEEPCHYLNEEFIKGAFDLEHNIELRENTQANGCTFEWDNNAVRVAFVGTRPFPSVYHAEYAFDKRYQPKQAGTTSGMSMAGEQGEAYTGPNPEGTVGSVQTPPQIPGMKRDSTMANDTARTPARVPVIASRPTEPTQSQGKFVAVKGIGDKAVWEPGRSTIHLLVNNHIINVQVKSGALAESQKQQAIKLARVLIDGLMHG